MENGNDFSKINLFYFTGTFSEGLLVIDRDNGFRFWVRRSYERAVTESELANIEPMNGYRDAAAVYSSIPDEVYLEVEYVPLAMLDRLRKYFPFKTWKSLDMQIVMTRAVKSEWELQFMKQAGDIHGRILEEKVPDNVAGRYERS
jgi:Xaa-Pro aminopeptidase